MTMTKRDRIKAICEEIHKRDKALNDGFESFKVWYKENRSEIPESEYMWQVIYHTSRANTRGVCTKLRNESKKWLERNGFIGE